jgi:DNA-binding transcriptional MerR regulator
VNWKWQRAFLSRLLGADLAISECREAAEQCRIATKHLLMETEKLERQFSPERLAELEANLQQIHNRALLELHSMYERARAAANKIGNGR